MVPTGDEVLEVDEDIQPGKVRNSHAWALAGLDSERALVVWGEDGLDELSLGAPTRTWEVVDGELVEGRLTPEELGLEPAPFEALAGGERAENARLFHAVLAGEERGPRADHLALNAGAALVVAGRAADVVEGIGRAPELIASGAVLAPGGNTPSAVGRAAAPDRGAPGAEPGAARWTPSRSGFARVPR